MEIRIDNLDTRANKASLSNLYRDVFGYRHKIIIYLGVFTNTYRRILTSGFKMNIATQKTWRRKITECNALLESNYPITQD
jgi:hypothetical protein